MKKYQKPMIAYENLSPRTNLSSDCENQTNLQSNDSAGCGIKFGNMIVFMDWMGACINGDESKGLMGFPVAEGQSFNGICYHTPVETNNLFNS